MEGIKREDLARRVDQALGRVPADLVIRDVRVPDLATGRGDFRGDVAIGGSAIVGLGEGYEGSSELDGRGLFAVPGFIDAHVHVESSLVHPLEFDRMVLPRGTTAAICDPHEIANVLGTAGIEWLLAAAERSVTDLFVMLPSCVPATGLETSGAELDAEDLVRFRGRPGVLGLAEMMNYPGVLGGDRGVLDKLAAFAGGPVDGHAPLVTGRELSALAAAGVRTCHESTTAAEAEEKLRNGIHVLLREGSAAKDVAALAPLIGPRSAPFLAFCTDDRNPLDIVGEGHLDHAIRKALLRGARPADVYRMASWSAARIYGLRDRGLVAPGYRADVVLLSDLEDCRVRHVVKDGRVVDDARFAGREAPPPAGLGSVRLDPVDPLTFRVPGDGRGFPVIGLTDGLLTEHRRMDLPSGEGEVRPDPGRDVLKVAVLERHRGTGNVGRGFVRGFGLREGALASSVGHDSHNVIVVGASDGAMAAAVNRLIALGGGFVAVRGDGTTSELALPIAGLMSDRRHEEVTAALRALRRAVAETGCPLAEAFLSLAFLPLPVIPHLKITDRGIVDVDAFRLLA